MTRKYSNNYITALNGAITNSATSIVVTSVANLPTVGAGDTCILTIDDGTNIEVIEVTSNSGTTLTVVRGQEGTSGTAFSDGALVELRATKGSFEAAGHPHAASDITSGTLAHERGGLEADVSAYDGFVRISGGSTSELKSNFNASTAPTATDDSGSGYVVGSRWIDTTNDKEYVCLDNTSTAAVWTETTGAGGGGSVSITGTPADNQVTVWTSSSAIEGTSAFTFNGSDLNVYETVNDGNPQLQIGSTSSEQIGIQTVYDSGAQTLDYTLFYTLTASATANKGSFRFSVDGSEILDIDDNGTNLRASKAYYIDDSSVLSSTTLGSGVTGSSLTSVGTISTGTWTATAIGAAYGGTGIDTSASTGVLKVSGGTWTADANFGDIGASGNATPTGTWDFGGATSLEIPNSATPTVNADGEIAIDTSVTDFSAAVMKYYGGEEMGVVAMPIAEFTSPTDGNVVAYNATNDEFELVATGGGDWTLISSATASSSSSIDFTGLSSTYSAYKLVFSGLVPQTDSTALYMVIGTGAGPTYQTGATDYGWVRHGYYVSDAAPTTATAFGVADASDNQVVIYGGAVGTGTGENANGEILLYDPSQTSGYHMFDFRLNAFEATPALVVETGSGTYRSTTAVTAVRLIMSSGNIASGEFRLYGLSDA